MKALVLELPMAIHPTNDHSDKNLRATSLTVVDLAGTASPEINHHEENKVYFSHLF